MWKCANCGEKHADEFEACWNCGQLQDGSGPDEFCKETNNEHYSTPVSECEYSLLDQIKRKYRCIKCAGKRVDIRYSKYWLSWGMTCQSCGFIELFDMRIMKKHPDSEGLLDGWFR